MFNKMREYGSSEILNLGMMPLMDLVGIMASEGLISKKLCSHYMRNESNGLTKEFLLKFENGKLDSYDFKAMPFTLLDHRRISELLIKLYPEKYTIGRIGSMRRDIHKFLHGIYELSTKLYYDLYRNVDRVSKITWWQEMITNHKDAIV